MQRSIGIAFALLLFAAAIYAFSPRPGPTFPPSEIKIGKLLMLDAAVTGERVVAVGERGSIFISDIQKNNWRRVQTPSSSTLTAVYFHDVKLGWAVGHDTVILRTNDSGETWSLVYEAPAERRPLFDVWFGNRDHGFAVGAYGSFYESSDGGITWQARKIFESDMHINGMAKNEDGTLFIVGEAGTLYRSNDNGRMWRPLPSPYSGSYFGILQLTDNSTLIYGLRGKIYRSTDLGRNWKQIDSKNSLAVFGGALIGDSEVALVGQNGALWLSKDYGKNLVLRKISSRKAQATVMRVSENELFLFGEGGVTRTAIDWKE